MFQRLSYFNLILAVIYLLIFLKDGTLNSTTGILMIIIFNWLGIRSYQLENYKWKAWHYLTGLWSLYYACFVLYGAVNVVFTAIEYEYLSSDTRNFLGLSFAFCLAVILQFVSYLAKYFKNK